MGNQHDQRIHALKNKGFTISDAIKSIVAIYEDLHGLDDYKINCGNCEEFACDVIAVVTGGDGVTNESKELYATWHDEQPDCKEYEKDEWSHKFIYYRGRYYDSQSPEGEDNWRDLSCFSDVSRH